MTRKITSIVLCISILLSLASFSSFAADDEYTSSQKTLYQVGEKAIQGLVSGIAAIIKNPGWQSEKDYVASHDMNGVSTEFIDVPNKSAKWSVGYGSESLQTGKELTSDCYVGGSLSVTKKLATAVYDDQRVRTIAMSDGRGITVFASLDAFGLANSEVLKIREMLTDYSAKHNITSINISTLHQHSCVDTYGMNGNLLSAFFTAPIKNIFGISNPSGQNEEFMAHLYTAVTKSIKDAVESMQTGELYYGTVDIAKYIKDKRDPQIIDGNMNRLRFVPDNESLPETWLINQAIHCVGMGAAGTTVTGDYPYYMEKYIKENAHNANFIMIQGAELAITSQYGEDLVRDPAVVSQYGERYAGLVAYGTELGRMACTISNDKPVAPILNYASKPYIAPTDNNILLLAAKCGLLTNTIVKTGLGKYGVVSEVGYAEFGTSLAITIAPGELAPEIAYGGAMSAEDSWTGTTWDFAPIKDRVDGKKLLVFGLTNDQIGYMLTDNSWHSFLCENEEIVAASSSSGSAFTTAFYALLDNCK